jgi:NTP pyrophosphatase (non-canonical NTP hydrolase)
MNEDHVKGRLHDAIHRGHRKATEEELAEVGAVVLAIATELATELAVVVADLAARVEALEKKGS